jgi:hypothetical protein
MLELGARGGKSFLSFDKDSLARLNNLSRAIGHYPNRIERAMNIAAAMTEKQLRMKLRNNFNNPKLGNKDVIGFESKSTKTKLNITVQVYRATAYNRKNKSRHNATVRANFDANIKMYGRMRYVAERGPSEKPFNLRNANGYRKTASTTIKVRAKSPNYRFKKLIKRDIVGMYGKNLKVALAQEGFGQRGGTANIRRDIVIR